MCIAVFMWQSHPLYPFVLLLNRDENHSRPTKPAGWWEGEVDILGGRDEVAGGTWLACSRGGRLAFLTNVREKESMTQAKSRGDLPVRFLKSDKDPIEFAREVIHEADQYNGFNLILVDLCSKVMVYVTNRSGDHKPYAKQVSPGMHVLTNASLNSPWTKAQRLLHNFKEHMNTCGDGELRADEMIENLMMDTAKADESTLPGIHSSQYEFQLSSIYVDTDTIEGRYGTRSTSAVLVKVSGEVCFHERYLEDNIWKDHMITYQIE